MRRMKQARRRGFVRIVSCTDYATNAKQLVYGKQRLRHGVEHVAPVGVLTGNASDVFNAVHA